MAFELTEDFIKDNDLTEAQVTSVTGLATNTWETDSAALKLEYDGLAIKNTDAMIDGAIDHTQKELGFELTRHQGEKNGAYLKRFNDAYFAAKNADITKLKEDYESKIKDFKGDEATAEELKKAKEALDSAQQTIAGNTELVDKGSKYDELLNSSTALKKEVCFGKVKPKFSEDVNEYEATAKWGDFVKSIENDYIVELVKGESIAISKENPHLTLKLKDLVAKDEVLTALTEGRKQNGLDGKQKDLQSIDGIPFKVPKGADSATRSKLINDYLDKAGVGVTSPKRVQIFQELNSKILEAK